MTAAIITDPTGEIYGFPTYPWKSAPKHLMTRRTLAKAGLRKNRQDPIAQMVRPHRNGRPPLIAYLYDSTQAAPRRPWTPAKQIAVQKAADSRKRCTVCHRQAGYVPRYGECNDCNDRRLYPHLHQEEMS
jgi:hypothetical protein